MSVKLFLSVFSTVLIVVLLWDRLVWSLESKSLFSIFLVTVCGSAMTVDCFSYANQTQIIDLIMRGIMFSYGLAAYSLYVQAEGLSGRTGLLPVTTQISKTKQWMDNAKAKLAISRGLSYWYLRCVTSILSIVLELFKDATSVALVSIYIVGVSAFGAFVFPNPLAFAFCYIGYFGMRRLLPEFLNLQWDALLLEAGVYGLLLSIVQSFGGLRSAKLAANACVALFKILCFRLMFGSGMVKHFSGDISWRDCTAMNFHFFTQPLPGVLAPILQAQPDIVKKISCFLALYIAELFVPIVWAISASSPLSSQIKGVVNLATFAVYGGLQLSISLGGNFGFFNLLSQVLALSLLEDSHLSATFVYSGVPLYPVNKAGAVSLVPRGLIGWVVTATILPLASLLLIGNLIAVLKLCNHCKLIPDLEGLSEALRRVPQHAGACSPIVPKPEGSLSSPTFSGIASANIKSPKNSTDFRISSMPEEEGEKDTNVGYLGIKRVCIDIFLLVYGTAINFHSSLGIFFLWYVTMVSLPT